MRALILCACFILCGCYTAQERAERQRLRQEREEARLISLCLQLGIAPESQFYAQCRADILAQEAKAREERRREEAERRREEMENEWLDELILKSDKEVKRELRENKKKEFDARFKPISNDIIPPRGEARSIYPE